MRLDNNKIAKIPANAFNGLSNLRQLYLNNNKISNIEKNAFNNLTYLYLLDLSFNQLSTLPNNLFSFVNNILMLYIHNNKWISFENIKNVLSKTIKSNQKIQYFAPTKTYPAEWRINKKL